MLPLESAQVGDGALRDRTAKSRCTHSEHRRTSMEGKSPRGTGKDSMEQGCVLSSFRLDTHVHQSLTHLRAWCGAHNSKSLWLCSVQAEKGLQLSTGLLQPAHPSPPSSLPLFSLLFSEHKRPDKSQLSLQRYSFPYSANADVLSSCS